MLPTRANDSTPDGVALVAQLLSTVDQTAAASLRLCHLAIESADRADPLDEWVAYALGQASDALPRVSYTASPPSLISHAEEAARSVAVAIDQAHADPPAAPGRSLTPSAPCWSYAYSPTSSQTEQGSDSKNFSLVVGMNVSFVQAHHSS